MQLDGGNANLAVTGSLTRSGNTVWDAGNDGSGSGLDADTLDGKQGADLFNFGYAQQYPIRKHEGGSDFILVSLSSYGCCSSAAARRLNADMLV